MALDGMIWKSFQQVEKVVVLRITGNSGRNVDIRKFDVFWDK